MKMTCSCVNVYENDIFLGIINILSTWHVPQYTSVIACKRHVPVGSAVVEYLTRDRGVAGSSLTGFIALCP